jgi:putative hydrolase of the HAD superfamily
MIKKMITFDLDDTLYPEREFVRSGFHAVAEYVNNLKIVEHNTFFTIAWQLFEEGTRNTIFNKVFELLTIDFSTERLTELVEIYRGHFPSIKPFKKALFLLESLDQKGIGLGLVSDGPHRTQQNKLSALGLGRYFNEIIFTGAFGSDWNKPSPFAFLEIMRRTKSSPDNCIYVADNPKKDFLGPKRLGWKTIRLRCNSGLYYDELPPLEGEPEITVYDFAELCDLLL